MFLTVHSAAGILIAENTGSVWLAFILGFISHFLLDMIPHGDNTLVKEKFKFSPQEISLLKKLTTTDILVMSVMISTLWLSGQITDIIPALFGIAGAVAPDFIQGIYILTKTPVLKQYFSIHWNLHYIFKKFLVPLKTGLIIQLISLIVFLSLIVGN